MPLTHQLQKPLNWHIKIDRWSNHDNTTRISTNHSNTCRRGRGHPVGVNIYFPKICRWRMPTFNPRPWRKVLWTEDEASFGEFFKFANKRSSKYLIIQRLWILTSRIASLWIIIVSIVLYWPAGNNYKLQAYQWQIWINLHSPVYEASIEVLIQKVSL